MESSAIARYIPQKSKKRVFSGSSSSCAEPEVIEIAPPLADRRSRMKDKGKQKEIAYHEIIDLDIDEDCNDVVLLEGNVESNKKRKRNMGISIGHSSETKIDLNKVGSSSKKGKEISGHHTPNGFNPGSNNFFDLDDYVFDDDYWTRFDSIGLPAGIEAPFPWLTESAPITNVNPSASQLNTVDPYTSSSKNNTSFSGQSNYFDSKHFPTQTVHSNFTQIGSNNNLFPNSNIQAGNVTSSYPQLTMNINSNYPQGFDNSVSKWHESIMKNHMELNQGYLSTGLLPGTGGIYSMNDKGVSVNGSNSLNWSNIESSSRMTKLADVEVDADVKKRYESFKKFDTVVDHSDHYYLKSSSASKQPPKNWAKKIQNEWRILEKDLPDTIFVRAYESRMDLLRAVIIGAEGTPYHDGLFFFDVCFPSTYPNTPPLVHYHSGGLRINPNLYNCGKVCLSLLNTWTGGQNERWLPRTSTMLQVLVSIQGLILNMKPYFNEPGFANSSGSVHGENSSLQYNENTLILSLKTMVYTMNKPPKHFEDLVIGHFQHRVRDILMACKAYTEGVQVGCLVKGGVQDVDEGNNKCSPNFKQNVGSYIKTLVAAFQKIGAKGAQDFVGLNVK